MKNVKKGIVVIYDKVEDRSGIDIYSDNLEFSSPVLVNALENAVETLSDFVTYYSSPSDFIDNIALHKDDIVLSTIWSGVNSRNRKILIPAICESYNIQYVGADAFVQSLGADKSLSKMYCKAFGMNVPNEVQLHKGLNHDMSLSMSKYPAVIKPNYEGSSIGISDNNIVYDSNQSKKLIDSLMLKYESILMEEYIEGMEVSACIVGHNDNIKLFEISKLILDGKDYFTDQLWGLESKKGGRVKQEREIITDKINEEMKNLFLTIFKSLGKVDFMRIDGRIRDGKFMLIELTPDCTLHPDCFMYFSFQHNGYSYADMISILIQNTLEYYNM